VAKVFGDAGNEWRSRAEKEMSADEMTEEASALDSA
jgi:hypothetical protein